MLGLVDRIFDVRIGDTRTHRLIGLLRRLLADARGVAHIPQHAKGLVGHAVEQQLALHRLDPFVMRLEEPFEVGRPVQRENLLHRIPADIGQLFFRMNCGIATAKDPDRPAAQPLSHRN